MLSCVGHFHELCQSFGFFHTAAGEHLTGQELGDGRVGGLFQGNLHLFAAGLLGALNHLVVHHLHIALFTEDFQHLRAVIGHKAGFVDGDGAACTGHNGDRIIFHPVDVSRGSVGHREGRRSTQRNSQEPVGQVHTVGAQVDHGTAAALCRVVEMWRQPVFGTAGVAVAVAQIIDFTQFAAVGNSLGGLLAYARIQSVLRKAAEQGIEIPAIIPAGLQLSAKEEGLIQMLADFKNTVKQAGTDYNPSVIANYAYDLVKEYNQFYHDFSILREENEALKVFRLALSQNVGKIVKLAMGLLGIEVPERM